MIYVFAPTEAEAAHFIVDYRLRGTEVKVFVANKGSEGLLFREDDEVYFFSNLDSEHKNQVRRNHAKSWPRPHIYKEVRYERAEAR